VAPQPRQRGATVDRARHRMDPRLHRHLVLGAAEAVL
jgi:hypothetical protein